jgi:cytochrome c peroxidase
MELLFAEPDRTAMAIDYLDPRLARRTPLTDAQVADVMAFLEALTDPRNDAVALRIPDEVPSGIPVDR